MIEQPNPDEELLGYVKRATAALETIAYVLVVTEARQQLIAERDVAGELLVARRALRDAGLTGD